MTLHWWMHWFWVTAQFLAILGNPVPSSSAEPPSEVQVHPDLKSVATESPSTQASPEYSDAKPSFRVAKAIGLYPQTNTAVILNRPAGSSTVASLMDKATTPESLGMSSSSVSPLVDGQEDVSTGSGDVGRTASSPRTVDERARLPTAKKESKITWILTSNKTGRSKYEPPDDKSQEVVRSRNATSAEDAEDLTVLPLQEEVASGVRLVLNRTRPSAPLLASSSLAASTGEDSPAGSTVIRTFNRSDDEVEIDQDFVEPQSFATAASILEVGASEPTRLSRARSAFPKDFQRDQVQGEDHLADYNESSHAEESELGGSSRSAVDIAAITGSCLATVVLLSTMGSLGFIMYRRRYLNPPQTLNSDKCSNPDSSGYIDDSTIRDNSEEMYSLDNDSFLNSLEAMTIQNYWTDSVKHTKL